MKKIKTILIIFLLPILTYSQCDYETEIFQSVINFEIEKGATELYFQCEKDKTFFTLTDFRKESVMKVPDSIMNEIMNSANNSFNSIWDPAILGTINYSKSQHLEKCLTKDEIIALFNSTKKRQTVLSISQPIFDLKHENCIVSITYWYYTGSASGHSYFIKKIYGKWVIIETFGMWIT